MRVGASLRYPAASAICVVMEPQSQRPGPAARLRRFAPLLLLAALAAAAHLLGYTDHLSLAGFAAIRAEIQAYMVSDYGWAIAGYMAAYAAATALSFPATGLLTAAGGFLFGWKVGAAAALVSGTVGAGVLFLAARAAAGDGVRRRFRGSGERLARGFEEDAFGYLVALRLAPVIPSFVVSVASAMLRVPLRTFLAATIIGRSPATLAYAVLGQGLDRALADAAAAGRSPGIADLLSFDMGLAFVGLAFVALLAVVTRRVRARRAA